MWLYVFPKSLINELKSTDKYVVISIYTPGDDPPDVFENDKLVDVLQLCFDDVTYGWHKRITESDIVRPFSKEDSDKIAEFVLKYKDIVDNIAIHCDAGISRSVGVMVALNNYFNSGDLTYLWSTIGVKHHNALVRDLVEKSLLENTGG